MNLDIRAGAGRFVRLVLFVVAAAVAIAGSQHPALAATAGAPPASVYVFRPIGGKFVSADMDDLAAKIAARGLEVQVFNYTAWMRPAKDAVRRYQGEGVKTPIIALGYSAGGDSAIRFALALKRAGVPVDLIITLDPTRIANRVPGNVGRFINIYASNHTLGGGDPAPAKDFQGHFAAVDLKNYPQNWHLVMPRMTGLQDQIVAKIADATAESPAAGPSIPIEYTMPRDTPLELWDSGVAVVAAAGDTAAKVAAQFGVPAWVVAEINKCEPDSPLPAGRRLVVPVHIGAAPPPGN